MVVATIFLKSRFVLKSQFLKSRFICILWKKFSADGEIRHHGQLRDTFYYETKEQAFEAIKQLNGKHLGGSEHGLKLKRIPRASQDINPSEK